MIKTTLFRTLFFLGCSPELIVPSNPQAIYRSKHYRSRGRFRSRLTGQPYESTKSLLKINKLND